MIFFFVVKLFELFLVFNWPKLFAAFGTVDYYPILKTVVSSGFCVNMLGSYISDCFFCLYYWLFFLPLSSS